MHLEVGRNARQRWLIATLQQLEQYQPTTTPPIDINTDEEMGEKKRQIVHQGVQASQ